MQLIVCTAVVLSCFFVYSFVYLFIYYSLYISSLGVFVCICLFITTLMSSYFSAWPSHSARLAFAISEWLCTLFFSQLFPFNVLTHFLYQKHNKDCCCNEDSHLFSSSWQYHGCNTPQYYIESSENNFRQDFFFKKCKTTCVQLSHGIIFLTFEDEHSGKPAHNKNEIKTN